MPTKIKRGQRLLIPFKDGQTIYDSQNRPRMYLTQKAFEKSFPWHLIDCNGIELVEYAEVVRCKDCGRRNLIGLCAYTNKFVPDGGFCYRGKRCKSE